MVRALERYKIFYLESEIRRQSATTHSLLRLRYRNQDYEDIAWEKMQYSLKIKMIRHINLEIL